MIQFSGSGTESDNSYAILEAYGQDGDTFSVSTTTSAGDATVFATTDACAIGSQGLDFLADVSSSTAAAIFFDTPGNIRDAGYITPTCKVSGGILSCSFQGADEFALCPESGSVSLDTVSGHSMSSESLYCRGLSYRLLSWLSTARAISPPTASL